MNLKPIHGIDVSHHQKAGSFNFSRKPEDLTFAYVRASYGKKVDQLCDDHCRDFWKVNLDVGLYLFVRDTETVDDQWDTLKSQFDEYGYSECPVPAIDAEWQYDAKAPSKSRTPKKEVYVPMVNELLRRTKDEFGEAILYTNYNFYLAMGSPKEWDEYPWWIANYSVSKPPTGPGGKTTLIWQHTVAPIPGFCSKDVDQNSLRGKLPRCN